MARTRTVHITGVPGEKGSLGVQIVYSDTALVFTDTPFGTVLELEDAHTAGDPGEPGFPVQLVRVALPAFSDIVKFDVTVAKATVTSAPVFVAPVQELQPALPTVKLKPSHTEPAKPAVTRPEFLRPRGVTPPRLPVYRAVLARRLPAARLVSLEHWGVATVATIELRPASQNAKGTIELSTEIRLTISYESTRTDKKGPFAGTRFFKPPRSYGEARRRVEILRAEVLNPNWVVDISQFYPILVGDCDYLVITDNQQWDAATIAPSGAVGDLVTAFTRLANWKKRRGLRTRVVTITDIVNGMYGDFKTGARDLQEVLRNFLKWAHTNLSVSWVLLGGDVNIIPTRWVAGDMRGYIGVETTNPPEDNCSYWTGTQLHMHVVNPGEWWPGGTPHVLVNPTNGALIPQDMAGTSSAANPGWYYTTNDSYSVRTANRTQYVVVNGPAALVNTTLQWLYEWNMLPSDLYYSSLVGPNYNLSGVHDWDLLDNGLYGQCYGTNNIDGVDFAADIGLGRAPVGSAAEADAFVTKVIAYEQLRRPDGTALSLDWPRRLTLVSTNFGGVVWISSTAASPPGGNQYHHDAAQPYTLIKIAEPFTDLKWRLFVRVTATDIRIIPYKSDAAAFGRGWYFAKSDTDLSPSELVITIFGFVFRMAIVTPWVVVYGNSDELAPANFIFDRTEADLSMSDQEVLRKQIATDFPAIDVVNRLYEDEVDLPAADAAAAPLQHITSDRVRDALNLGPHFLSLSGHGSQGGCCGVDGAMAQAAANGFLQPITYAMSCLTADFGAQDATSEKLVFNPNGGAVAYVGYTRFGWIGVGDDFERAFFTRLKTTRHLALLNDSRLTLWHVWTKYVQILLGDPEMPVWVGKPKAIKVVHPSEIVKAAQDVVVEVKTSANAPLKDAVVSLAMGPVVTWATTDASGKASVHVNPSAAGTMEVVVTATDCVPYFGTLTVKEKITCTVMLQCKADILCKSLVSCQPAVSCSALVSCGASILCGAKITPCVAKIACGASISGCKAAIGPGCPKIDPIPFKDFIDVAKACGVKDVKELAEKQDTPRVKKVLAKLSPANRKALVMMLKKIGND
jgi:hypothetical protein